MPRVSEHQVQKKMAAVSILWYSMVDILRITTQKGDLLTQDIRAQ